MRVIVTHSGYIQPETRSAFERYAPEAEFVETEGYFGYNEVIASRWDGSDDLVVIEQDKEITAEVLPSFEACGHEWCSYSYRAYPGPYQKLNTMGLGCTRYSIEAQRSISVEDFLRFDYQFLPLCKSCNGSGCWRYLDNRISLALMAKGFEIQVHGEIRHHHKYPDLVTWVKSLRNSFEVDERILTLASSCPVCGAPLYVYNGKLSCSSPECFFVG